MVTKEQERKALEQIKKIVDSLGADSYIATAFDGCFEDARENIENDFALCMKDRYETERKRAKDLQEEVDRLKADLRKEKEVSEELGKAIKKTQEQENATIQMIESERDTLKCQVADLLDMLTCCGRRRALGLWEAAIISLRLTRMTRGGFISWYIPGAATSAWRWRSITKRPGTRPSTRLTTPLSTGSLRR